MPEDRAYRELLLFVTLYVLLSLGPFLALNRGVVATVYRRVAPLGVVALGGVVALVAVLLVAAVRADEGIDRYVQFIVRPSDALSVLIALAFLLAAVAWWAVPEAAFLLEVDVTLGLLLVGILVCQVPMLLVLSLLTAAGRAASGSPR
jgi:hypothetical protein